MEEAFRAILLGASGVTAFAPAGRINWGEHPQGAGLPGVVITSVSGAEGLTLKGPDGLLIARLQVDCYAGSFGTAKQLSRAVVAVLHGYRGGGFRLVEHLATRESRESGTNEAARPFRVSLDFTITWRTD